MNIMLLGAPGSGKGTLAEKLIKNNGFTQLSTGDLMRKEIASKTLLGLECASYMNGGSLVPDDVTNGIVKNYLATKHDNLIFDGYPRTLNQAQALESMLEEFGSKISMVVYIDVHEDHLLSRISGRWICPLCKVSYHEVSRQPKVKGICDNDQTALIRRPDDEPDKVQIRLKAYANETAPLVEYFAKNSGFIHIEDDGKMTPEHTYDLVMEKFNGNNN